MIWLKLRYDFYQVQHLLLKINSVVDDNSLIRLFMSDKGIKHTLVSSSAMAELVNLPFAMELNPITSPSVALWIVISSSKFMGL